MLTTSGHDRDGPFSRRVAGYFLKENLEGLYAQQRISPAGLGRAFQLTQ